MKIIADTHTHTLASGDAFSTITENIMAAKKKGLRALAITDHTTSSPSAPESLYFYNTIALPDIFEDVILIRGAEVNILDYEGTLDLPDSILDGLEWVIASMHKVVMLPQSKEDHTRAWLAIAENPLVDLIGHCGDPTFAFELEPVMQAFAKNEKVVEINTHSPVGRPGSELICREVASLCKKYSIPVVVNSDAHFHGRIGEFEKGIQLLNSLDFPEELVLNADLKRLLTHISKRSKRKFPPELCL